MVWPIGSLVIVAGIDGIAATPWGSNPTFSVVVIAPVPVSMIDTVSVAV
jgi:hypothetical protein